MSAIEMQTHLQELEASALIGKPFDLDALYSAVDDVLTKPG